MKPPRLPSLFALLLAAALSAMPVHADTSQPMFATSTLDIHGNTYTWDSASEDGTWHYDTYNGPNGSVTVTGMIGFPNLARVSGGGIDGHLQYGVYGDNQQSWQEEGTFDNNGYTYTHYSGDTSYYPDLATGQLGSSGSYTYSGSSGNYSYSWDAYGGWSWSQSVSGSETGGSSRVGGHTSFELFGTTYLFTHSHHSWSHESGGESSGTFWDYTSSSSWTDHYASADDGWLRLRSSQTTDITGVSMPGDTTVTGWDPLAGHFSASQSGAFTGMEGLVWEARPNPSFAPAQLWLNGTLVNWVAGEISLTGLVTDTYEQGWLSMVVTGQVREFEQGLSQATVTINGSSGTLDNNYGFSGLGWDIQSSEPLPGDPDPDPGLPDPNPDPGIPVSWTDSSPFFTGTSSLWVDGTEYPFVEGYQDDTGHRTDKYENASAGTVTLIGNTVDPGYADVQINQYSGPPEHGQYSGGVFVTYLYSVSTTQPEAVYGPDTLWLRGQMYARVAVDSSSFESAAGHGLSIGSNDGGGTLEITGADAAGSFSGTVEAGAAGIHFIHDEQNQPSVPVIAANGDGSLQLPAGTLPEWGPPALMVSGRGFWQHLGTLPDGGTGQVAWYGNALGLGGTDAAQGGGQLLGIHVDGEAANVVLVDYYAGSTVEGSYSPVTHLFQTSGPGSGFPVPVYGVDPTDNHRLWQLPEVPESLPPSFVVRGKSWWYAGADAAGNALYQGFYNNQLMTLGAADAAGQRLVTLSDPSHNNGTATSGTLSSERKSVRLRDGTLVLSGTEQGTQAVVQHVDQHKLHTIAADLDLLGNNLSFGILQGDASLAGALFQFSDQGGTASLHSILSRPQAQWGWWKAEGLDGDTLRPVMWLGSDHRLNLYKPGAYDAPAIVLDPAGTSSFQGPVRVPMSGDIPMGIYQEGDPP